MQARGFALALPLTKALLALAIGIACGLLTLTWTDDPLAPVSIPLAMALAWAAMIDIDRYRLPDLLTYPMIAGGLLYWVMVDAQQAPIHLVGAAAGYLSLVLVAALYRALRKKEGLGLGDAKLLAAAGAWLGWQALPFVVLLGSTAALGWAGIWAIVRGRGVLARPLPFGPFIAIAFWALWVMRPWPLA